MEWVEKTPMPVGISACEKQNVGGRVIAATAIGIALAMAVPGQMSNAHYTSFIPVAEVDEYSSQKAVSLASVPMSQIQPEKQIEKQVETVKLVPILPVPAPKKKAPAVQLASIDLDMPSIKKPKIYVEPKPDAPVPNLRGQGERYKTPQRLERKLFGSVELRFEDERKIRAWSGVYQKFITDVAVMKTCLNTPSNCNDPVLADWAGQLRGLKNLSDYQKIDAVNAMANRQRFAYDSNNYGRSDYWASPREFLLRAGDCEDFALLKFASLMALGMDDKNLRLVVGRLSNGTPHAFLAAKLDGKEYILDNRESQVYLTTHRTDYVPKYSMNLSYRWSHIMPKTKARAT